MLKHVGRHGERKVVVAYNKVPGEDHMGLVIYSDSLPSMLHDEVMKCVESAAGQAESSLADALFRHVMPDGNNALTALHTGGFLKKVQTKQIILQPNAKTTVRLDELNDILFKMSQGEEAIRKMAEVDAGRGFRDPSKTINEGRELGEPARAQAQPMVNTSTGVLSDADIAADLLKQASQMEAQAKTLLAEVKRLTQEAHDLNPPPKAKKAKAKNVKPATKKTTA